MKRGLFIALILSVLVVLGWMAATAASPGPDTPVSKTPPPSEDQEEILAVEDAIYAKIEEDRRDSIFFWNRVISVEATGISEDGQWAASIMVPTDPSTDLSPETEPALAMTIQENGDWYPLFPNDPGWLEAVENAPDDLLSPEHKEVLLQMNINAAVTMPTSALGGYLLPWENGDENRKYLTGSTCHDGYIESGNAHYSFDFAYNRTMWDILAVKSAEVWVWKDDVPTCYEPSCWDTQPTGNYIVLRDTSTDPVTYQLYLHLKQDSIPDEIKVRGFRVQQGQFIGIVDNTGQSSGSHLHFQVQVPYLGEDHYWGRSVDITFDDVDVNGGRPRIHESRYCLDFNFCDRSGDVCNTSQLYYTSQNQRVYPEDSTPPIGGIINPTTGETYKDATLPIQGWAEDLGDPGEEPSGLQSAQIMAFYNGSWQDIGPAFNTPTFAYDWDWCSEDVPEGPVSVALRITDHRGNQTAGLPGLQHITKHYDCSPQQPPQPACQPALDEIAIFDEINYQGDCQILDSGNYPHGGYFGPVGDNNTSSILVGSSVQAELFTEINYQGRSEILRNNDANLSDNLTASGTLSSLKVSSRTSSLIADSPSDLRSAPEMESSTTVSVVAPYSDTLEGDTSGWTTSIDEWWTLSEAQSHSATHSWRYGIDATNNYDDGSANAGILESPLIALPVSSDPYVLQFWYRAETESRYMHWDQRWVQISVDGGDFVDAYQLSNDPMLGWFRARIDLLPYYGDMTSEHTVQVRFFFDTIDQRNNGFEGWFIDDFQIQAEPVTSIACPDDLYEPNDTPQDAKKLSYGVTANAAICPGWDLDYYRFDGSAGDRVVVDIDAKSIGSNLDGYLFLLDSDGRSELAENDDEILYEKQDPLLAYTLTRDGQYYLKFQAWDHPMGVGEYSLKLIKGQQNPTIQLINPIEGGTIPQGSVTLVAEATNVGSGVRYVQFLYHSSNWETGKWLDLGTDEDGADGWTATFDTSALPEGELISIYAIARDWSGNWNFDVAWRVRVDARPLSLNLNQLPNPSESTALELRWSLSGAGAATAPVTVEQRTNNGDWSNVFTNIQKTKYWFIGEANNSYAFRISAHDYAGNEVTGQTNTNIPAASILCSQPDEWDTSESINDNSHTTATEILLNASAQRHNFCNPATGDFLNDEDWLSFTAEAGQPYALFANPTGDGSAAVTIRLYAANGTTLLAETEASDLGRNAKLYWKATQSGTIYIQLQHINGNVAGNGVAYTIQLTDGVIYVPLINK